MDHTVLVVDGDDQSRAAVIEALRRLGVRALGVAQALDAALLLAALDADLTLVRDAEDRALLAPINLYGRLLHVAATAPLDETVVAVLRALGRPDEAALAN